MKKILSIITFALLLGVAGCKKDSDFLNVLPTSILTNEQAFSDPAQVLSILANLYNRQLDFSSLDDVNGAAGWVSMADFSESFPSENGRAYFVQRTSWGFGEWSTWDYGYIRELNLFIERAEKATALSAADKSRFIAEARFLRANYYFEMVKRMGGVPLIKESLLYDFGGDPKYLQYARSKESEVYDFVIAEAEAIKTLLPVNAGEKGRATKGAALAMEARAALYAGSIAKYGANTPQVTLAGGEVGIPASMAAGYYTKALAAAKEVIDGSSGAYSLYNKKADLAENFANIFIDKGNNPESIFVEDFKLKSGKVHGFTVNNQPRYGAEEEEGGRINPSLNLVESFEKLDNTFARIPHTDAAGNPIFYTNQADIFAGRDARLGGTVILPGTSFKGRAVDIWNGYQLADGSILTGDDRGAQKVLPGGTNPVQVVGFDGPVNAKEFTAQSGFYLRKYVDPAAGAGSRGTNSELPFIRYRYAEVLLNAAEAAFELGQAGVAAGYMNQVRARAGLVIPLTAGEITFDRVVHERRAELSFEGHVLFDMKRWRLAHVVWDGVAMSVTDLLSNIGSASKRNTQPYALWPYKLYDPASPNNGKWLYKIVLPGLVTGSNRFQLGNYYSFIDDNIRGNNPKIVKQPNQ
ncbi:MAG: RagB/SusD family nutrient uptake outer membrane protein [Chitinophagaceae bacterium]